MRKVINLRVPLIIAISLMIGIATSYFIYMQNILCAIIFPTLFGVCVISYFILSLVKGNKIEGSIIFISMIAICVIGCGLFNLQVSSYSNNAYGNHYFSSIVGRVNSVSKTENGYMLIVDELTLNDKSNIDCKGKASVYINQEKEIDVGDVVKFKGYLNERTGVYENRLSSTYIERDIRYVCTLYGDDIVVVSTDKNVFDKVNVFIRDSLSSGLDGVEFSVAYALLTGNAEYIDDEVINNFRQAGVAHIFAVSGLHIGFLSTALLFAFRKLRLNKYASAILVISCTVFYAGVCGFSASSVRATIMCATMLCLSLVGERYDGLSALSIACVVILLLSPVQLFCVGFQLSFAVVFGILVCSRAIGKCFRFLPKKVASNLGAVISAYLFSIPICLYAFRECSSIAVIVNLLFIPLVSVIYLILLVSVLVGGTFNIASVILFPSKYILKAVIFVINVVDYEIFMYGGFSLGIFALLYYATMLVACGFINLKTFSRTIISVALSVVCVSGTIAMTLVDKSKTKIYVSGNDGGAFTFVDTPSDDILIVSQANTVVSVSRLKRIITDTDAKDITVIFQNFEYADVQVVLTRINFIVDVTSVYYYGVDKEKNERTERVVKSSFRDIEIYAYADRDNDINVKEEIAVGNVKFSTYLDGKCLVCKGEEINFAVFGGFNEKGISYEQDVMPVSVAVAYDNLERINALYKPSKLIAYRRNSLFTDGETQGNFIYYLD